MTRRIIVFLATTVLACLNLSAQDDRCAVALQQGIFNQTNVNSSSQLKTDVDDLIYQSEFKTHSEANAAGFSLGFPVYGVPLQIGGTFSDQQRDTWKKDYVEHHHHILSKEDAYSAATKQVSKDLVDAWLKCISLTSIDGGLTAGIQPRGRDYVYFWVRYVPLATGEGPAQISVLQTTGVADKDKPIKVGDKIPLEAGGLGGLYKVADPNNVSFLVRATYNGQPRGTVAPHLNLISSAPSAEVAGAYSSAGAIVGEIRSIAFGGDKTSSAVANLRKLGWMECKGQPLNVLEYPELYDVIRENWGSTAPGIVFNAPNLSGVFLRGWHHGTGTPTPDANINPNDGLTPHQNPSNPGDPDVATRVAAQPGGSAGDSVGSFQDAHLEGFPHTLWAPPKALSPLPPNCCAYYMSMNPHEFYMDNITQDSNPDRHDIAPKNVYVMYIIYAGRPILDTTP